MSTSIVLNYQCRSVSVNLHFVYCPPSNAIVINDFIKILGTYFTVITPCLCYMLLPPLILVVNRMSLPNVYFTKVDNYAITLALQQHYSHNHSEAQTKLLDRSSGTPPTNGTKHAHISLNLRRLVV